MRARPLSIAVVMATYNGARFVLEQMQSLAAQSRLPDRLVVTDDGSSDETLEIVRAFAATAPFPVEISANPKQLGFGENFLQAASGVDADILAFCDQDDVWRSDKLERVEEAFVDPDVQVCVHTADLIDAEGRALPGSFTQGLDRDRVAPRLSLRPWGVFFGFTMTFRSSLLGLLPVRERSLDPIRPPAQLAHDRWVYFLGSVAGKTAMLAQPLAQYRQHGANLYGAKKIGAVATAAMRDRQALYFTASEQKLRLLERACAQEADATRGAMLGEAAEFWRAVVRHQRGRLGHYEMRPGLERIRTLASNLASNVYRLPHDGRISWRAVARDALSAFKA